MNKIKMSSKIQAKFWFCMCILSLTMLLVSLFIFTIKGWTDYNAACHMSDLIRAYEDHIADSLIQDNGCFEELEGIFLYDYNIDLKDYVWCY